MDMNNNEARKLIPQVLEDLRQAIRDELASDREYTVVEIVVMGETLKLLEVKNAEVNLKRGIAASVIADAMLREDEMLASALVAGMVLGLGDEDVLPEDHNEMKSRDVLLGHDEDGVVRLGMHNISYELPWASAVQLSLEILVQAKIAAQHVGVKDMAFHKVQLDAMESSLRRATESDDDH